MTGDDETLNERIIGEAKREGKYIFSFFRSLLLSSSHLTPHALSSPLLTYPSSPSSLLFCLPGSGLGMMDLRGLVVDQLPEGSMCTSDTVLLSTSRRSSVKYASITRFVVLATVEHTGHFQLGVRWKRLSVFKKKEGRKRRK